MLENSEVLNNQAIELAAKGEYTEAIACFKRAITVERENYLLWFNLAITYRDAGDLQDAKNCLKKAHYINSEDEEVIETLANICYSMNDITEAFEYVSTGLSLFEDSYRLWNLLGVLYFHQMDYESASEAFEQALSINPYYFDALYNLRDAYIETGNSIGANECSKKMQMMGVHRYTGSV